MIFWRMGSLNNPDIVAREIESYSWHMDFGDEGPDALEDVYTSSILDAKYEKVDIEEIIKDNCSRLGPGKQHQLHKSHVIKTWNLMGYWKCSQVSQCI